jgi:WD40 repeat protein
MSLDQRLREHLRSTAEMVEAEPIDSDLRHVVARGRRRRSTRRAVVASCVIAVVVVAAAVLPSALGLRDLGRIRPAERRELPDQLVSSEPLFIDGGYGLGFSADGSVVFVRDGTSGAVVRDASSGRVLDTVEGRHGNAVVAFSPDGGTFVTVGGGAAISELDTYVNGTATGKLRLHLRRSCCFSTFSPDGSRIALPYAGHTRVIAVADGEPVDEFEEFGNVAFSPDGGRLLVIGSTEHGVVGHVYEIGGTGGPSLTLGGELGDDPFANGPAWSPDGSMIAAMSGSGDVILWDAETGRHAFTISPPTGRFTSLAFGADAAHLATGSSDGTAIVWTLSSDGARMVFARDTRIGNGKWLTVALSPDGTRLMTASRTTGTKVWGLRL